MKHLAFAHRNLYKILEISKAHNQNKLINKMQLKQG
jgi:hypothetical protein